MDAITLKQLRALAAVDQAGSLTGASVLLNVTTPAVSAQLRLLEDNLGAPLLIRDGGGPPRLTDEGRCILETVNKIEHILGRCDERLSALREGKAGHVALGVVSTGKYFAPRLIKQAQILMPGIEFSLHIGNREQIRQALVEERVDAAIMGRPPRHPPVEAIGLGDHPYVLIASPDHPLAAKQPLVPDDLLDQTFLCREPGSGTRILTDRFIDEVGNGQLIRTMELGTNETIKQGVMADLGIAIISGHTVAQELQTGRLVLLELPGLPLHRQWYLIRRLGSHQSQALIKFQEFLEREAANVFPVLRGPVQPDLRV